MYRIRKTVEICAGHFLYNLPPDHPCMNQHGHNYTVEVELEGSELDRKGMLLDFGVISEIVKRFDHQNLNDLPAFGPDHPPTAENLAEEIRGDLQSSCTALTRQSVEDYKSPDRKILVTRVRVWETKTSWAEVTVR